MPWEALIAQARTSFADPEFDRRERTYKLEIAEALRGVLELARDGGDWTEAMKSAFHGQQYNLSDWRQHDWLFRVEDAAEPAVRSVLAGFLDLDLPELQRFQAFEEVSERFADGQGANAGSILAVGSVFNFAAEPERLPPVKTTVFRKAEDAVDFPRPKGSATDRYEAHLRFSNLAMEKLKETGLPVRDILDVQSVVWEFFQAATDRSIGLHDFLERILAEYPTVRTTEPFGRESAVWQAFEEARVRLAELDSVAGTDTVNARFSLGQGNWARIPWFAFLDSRETDSTQRGVYPVYLFRQDGSGVYLTLAQGVTEPKNQLGTPAAHEALKRKADALREFCPGLSSQGFALDGKIDLRSDPGIGRDYEVSVAAHKLYEQGAVPDDAELVADLDAMLHAYETYLSEHRTGDLAALVAGWRAETGYPTERHRDRIESRLPLKERLSEDLLLAVEADPDRFGELEFGKFVHGSHYGSPGPMSIVNEAVKTSEENRVKVARALRHLIYGSGSAAQRIDDVVGSDEFKVSGFGETLAVKALAASDPDTWIPVYPYTGDRGKRAVMESPELGIGAHPELEEMSVGQRAQRSNDLLRSVLEPHIPSDPWGQMTFLYWLRDRNMKAPSRPTSSLSDLAKHLYLPESWIEEVLALATDKGQIIFKGPPGTGKTYVAKELAHHIAGDPARVRLVQFHASYAYEDFVQGYRPVLVGETPAFQLVDGPLVEMATKAAADRDHTYVLLIDELNRGNVAKVFGELYFLLEYRGESVRLQYGARGSEPDFELPENLWFIGTMNTADQSIALLDSALRRRFYFVDFYPTEAPVQELLPTWLAQNGYGSLSWLPEVIEEVNRRLGDREIALGPSYFLDPEADLTEERVDLLWRHAVLPYLEEQFFGDEEKRSEFELANLRAAVSGAEPEQAEENEGGESDGLEAGD